jgi:hypothetical protein
MAGPLGNFQVVKWHDVDFSQYCWAITANLVFNVGTLLLVYDNNGIKHVQGVHKSTYKPIGGGCSGDDSAYCWYQPLPEQQQHYEQRTLYPLEKAT